MTASLIVAAFLVGVLAGREVDDTYYLARDWVKGRRHMPTDRKERRSLNILLGMLVAVMACNVGLGVLLQVSRVQQSKFTECSRQYQQQFREAYDARLSASTEASATMDSLVARISTATKPEDSRGALAEYLNARTKAKATAIANPYPPLPDSFCGESR